MMSLSSESTSLQAPDSLVKAFFEGSGQPLPLILQPEREGDDLVNWLVEHRDWVLQQRTRHGALWLRDFGVSSPEDFERVALALEPDLKEDYYGTSPRESLGRYAFTASELPDYYPIPQHCEMSYVAQPPRSLFFWCGVAPSPGSGETPLCDFRKVYAGLKEDVRERFEAGGIRIIRNYDGPNTPQHFDLWKLKRWDEIFLTTDRSSVEKACAEQGFVPQWLEDDRLRLITDQPTSRLHPITGEKVWFNHAQVFHLSAAPYEYRRIVRHRPTMGNLGWCALIQVLAFFKIFKRSLNQSLHCTYLDGSEIPRRDMVHLFDVIWENLVVTPWREGDVAVIDNFSVAHGRLPYRGARRIAVAWA